MGMNNFTGGSNPGNNAGGGGLPNGFAMPQQGGDFEPEDYLINYNVKFAQGGNAMFRDGVINQTMSVLIGKDKPNALLVGAAGVGKTKIVEDIAHRIVAGDPTLPDRLKDCTIWELPLSNIVAGSSFVGQVEEKIQGVIDFVCDPKNNAILFIDEIHQLMNDSQTYGKIAQILKPALSRGEMKVIGATTLQESQKLINDPAFNRRFSRIIVDELTREQTLEVLITAKASYINHYKKVLIDDDTLETVAIIADQYSAAGNHRPDTALTLLDRACGDAVVARKIKEQKLANDPALLAAFKANPGIPITESQIKNTALKLMTGQAKKETLDVDALREQLSVIKGQDNIIDNVITRLAKDDKGLFPRKTPLTFLFAGTSGVGKTEVTKIIANEMTGVKPITLNMTEFHSSASINRIIGSPAGYIGSDSNAELPFDCLESNPYQIILLDEFEKADKAVQRLFMGAFDEGSITTARGKTVDFSKSIIIATTNASHSAGSSGKLGFLSNNVKDNESDKYVIEQLRSWFDTELLNRFTKIFTFHELTNDIYKDILADIYKKEMARIKSEHRGIQAPDELDDATLSEICEKTYIPSFGARPAKKAIRDYIEDIV